MPDFISGELILVDKPLKWTSFDVVNKLKFMLQKTTGVKKIKVGHAGTLDPLASGLLIICTGKKTKIIQEIQSQEKEYTGIINLGATTPSYDLETEPENIKKYDHLTVEEIKMTAKQMEGDQEQLPPIFSAKKIDGKRAYELARKGEVPKMNPRAITITSFTIDEVKLPEVYFTIRCSKGTYIRSIAHDFGQKLEAGAYLKSLRRTKIGNYFVSNALQLEEMQALADNHKAL